MYHPVFLLHIFVAILPYYWAILLQNKHFAGEASPPQLAVLTPPGDATWERFPSAAEVRCYVR